MICGDEQHTDEGHLSLVAGLGFQEVASWLALQEEVGILPEFFFLSSCLPLVLLISLAVPHTVTWACGFNDRSLPSLCPLSWREVQALICSHLLGKSSECARQEAHPRGPFPQTALLLLSSLPC